MNEQSTGLIAGVYAMAESILSRADDVHVVPSGAELLGDIINGMPAGKPIGAPVVGMKTLSEREVVLYELTLNAVNFCYWYGDDRIKPASTVKLQECMNRAWHMATKWGPAFISYLIGEMVEARFTMMNERRMLLLELLCPTVGTERFVDIVLREAECPSCPVDMDGMLRMMIRAYPGYGSDQFLKRAFLFFMQLHRRMGWFKNGINAIPVPADYQVPKMLEEANVIVYSNSIWDMIKNRRPIPANSRIELEIRAATIIACRDVACAANVTIETVDNYLWLRRNSCKNPHHLTTTTDY